MRQEMCKLLSNGRLEKYTGQSIVVNNMVYGNPSENVLRLGGYLPMGEAIMPEYDPEKEYPVVDHYETSSDGSEIIAVYTTVARNIEETAEAEPDINERVAVLEQENAWLKEALEMLLEGAVENESVEE